MPYLSLVLIDGRRSIPFCHIDPYYMNERHSESNRNNVSQTVPQEAVCVHNLMRACASDSISANFRVCVFVFVYWQPHKCEHILT